MRNEPHAAPASAQRVPTKLARATVRQGEVLSHHLLDGSNEEIGERPSVRIRSVRPGFAERLAAPHPRTFIGYDL